MSSAQENHAAAAYGAIDAIGQLQEMLAVATDRAEMAMGAILEATGSTEVESARNALDYLAGAKERVNESYGMCVNAVAELRRYAGGF